MISGLLRMTGEFKRGGRGTKISLLSLFTNEGRQYPEREFLRGGRDVGIKTLTISL
jgi:hypothetical protein